jgi:hypothetical protein
MKFSCKIQNQGFGEVGDEGARKTGITELHFLLRPGDASVVFPKTACPFGFINPIPCLPTIKLTGENAKVSTPSKN